MGNQFEGQVAVITGGGSGLGLAIATRLAAEGARVAMIDLREEPLQAAVQTVGANGAIFPCDVTNEAQVAEVMGRIAERMGRIDILVNSAGVTGRTNVRTHEVEFDDFKFVFDVNVNGCFLTSRAALPVMLRQGYGRILHISSIAGKEGNAGMLAYSAAKSAVIGMAKVQGKEYAENGITVNALAPAVIRTAMVDALPEAQVSYMTDKIPMKRCGTLEEIANLAAFIVSPGASFTTGFTFDMTGGRATY
ncbi:MAG: SDR family NAD(P)-dependent oxidoreductase [Blastocatellia bacterium]